VIPTKNPDPWRWLGTGGGEIGRNPDVRKTEIENDVNAAYQTALLWTITGDVAYTDKALQIVTGWTRTLRSVSGQDAILAAGIYGFKLVSAAELLRYTSPAWSSQHTAEAEDTGTDAASTAPTHSRSRSCCDRRGRPFRRTIQDSAPCCSRDPTSEPLERRLG